MHCLLQLKISHHWFRLWLSTITQQAITWTNVDLFIISITRNQLQWTLNKDTHLFNQENAFEYVICKMTTMLLRPLYIKHNFPWLLLLMSVNISGWFVCQHYIKVIHRQHPCQMASMYHDTGNLSPPWKLNMLRPELNGWYFADSIFTCILLGENIFILIHISSPESNW